MTFVVDVDEIVRKDRSGLLSIHPSWIRVRLREVANVQNGFAFSSKLFSREKGVPLIRIRDIASASTETRYFGEYSEEYVVQNGDLLVGMDGDFNCSLWAGEKALLNQRVCRVSLYNDEYDSRFLYYVLQPYLNAVNAETSAVTVKHLSSTTLQRLPLPRPAFHEQRGIAAKLDEVFSDLDAGVTALERAKANLKRYRAAVLKAAIEGKLTEEWRAEHPDVEPASKLLERILAERRQKWEASQLAKYAAADKQPPNNWRTKYVEPMPPDLSGLPQLPNGWCWASVQQLIDDTPQNGAYYPKSEYGRGIPILRIDDFQLFWSRPASEMRLVDAPSQDCAAYGLRENDLVINRVNSKSHLGKSLLVGPEHVPAIFESNMMRLRLTDDRLAPFLREYLRSDLGLRQVTANAKWAVNQASINQQDVMSVPLPLPPLDEQPEILRGVAEVFSRVDAAAVMVEQGQLRARRLRQGILRQAFKGKLLTNVVGSASDRSS